MDMCSTTSTSTGSAAAASRITEVLRLPAKQVMAIHNGIQQREALEAPASVRTRLDVSAEYNGLIMGMVAIMEPRKGHSVLLKALAILKKRVLDLPRKLIVWLEGEGPLKDSLADEVTCSGLNEMVFFVDNETDIFSFMNAVDMIALPSVGSEDFPNVVIEAMSLGKAVVASAIAGTVEQVVPDETGLLVPPGNPVALADAIERFIDQPALVERFGKAGRERFLTNFTAEIAVAKYLDLYQHLTEEQK